MKLSKVILTVFAVFAFANVVVAKVPTQLVRPVARPAPAGETPPEFAVFLTDAPGLRRSVRPEARPHVAVTRIVAQPVLIVRTASTVSLSRSLRPQIRPKNLQRKNTIIAASFIPKIL